MVINDTDTSRIGNSGMASSANQTKQGDLNSSGWVDYS